MKTHEENRSQLKEQQPPAIMVKHLKKAFGDNVVLDDFNLVLHRGENVAVLDKSGSGKSVLIKCIIGLLAPDSGLIEVLGEDVQSLDGQGLDRMRTRVGFLFQSNALYDSMTVRENLEFPLRRHWMNMEPGEVNKLVMEALENVGLAHTVDRMPVELSGGMRKRIALARTLIPFRCNSSTAFIRLLTLQMAIFSKAPAEVRTASSFNAPTPLSGMMIA